MRFYGAQSVPVVWELLGLFVAFAKEEAQHGNPGANRAEVVAPNALREALSELNSCLFSIGEPACPLDRPQEAGCCSLAAVRRQKMWDLYFCLRWNVGPDMLF
jgi:hypothetical protein